MVVRDIRLRPHDRAIRTDQPSPKRKTFDGGCQVGRVGAFDSLAARALIGHVRNRKCESDSVIRTSVLVRWDGRRVGFDLWVKYFRTEVGL